jgi:hypothetical protein
LNYRNWWNPKYPAGGVLLWPCIFLMPLSTTGLLFAKDFFNTLRFLCDIRGGKVIAPVGSYHES